MDLGADCVLYMPSFLDVDELCRLLASGINVVTTCGHFHHPASWIPTCARRCRRRASSARPRSTARAAVPVSSPRPSPRLDVDSAQARGPDHRRVCGSVATQFTGAAVRPDGFRAPRGPVRSVPGRLPAVQFWPSLRLVAHVIGMPLESVQTSGRARRRHTGNHDRRGHTAGGQRRRPADHRRRYAGRPPAAAIPRHLVLHHRPRARLGCARHRLAYVGRRRPASGRRHADARCPWSGWRPCRRATRPNRTVNAVPYVCVAPPGTLSTLDLPQIVTSALDREAGSSKQRV